MLSGSVLTRALGKLKQVGLKWAVGIALALVGIAVVSTVGCGAPDPPPTPTPVPTSIPDTLTDEVENCRAEQDALMQSYQEVNATIDTLTTDGHDILTTVEDAFAFADCVGDPELTQCTAEAVADLQLADLADGRFLTDDEYMTSGDAFIALGGCHGDLADRLYEDGGAPDPMPAPTSIPYTLTDAVYKCNMEQDALMQSLDAVVAATDTRTTDGHDILAVIEDASAFASCVDDPELTRCTADSAADLPLADLADGKYLTSDQYIISGDVFVALGECHDGLDNRLFEEAGIR